MRSARDTVQKHLREPTHSALHLAHAIEAEVPRHQVAILLVQRRVGFRRDVPRPDSLIRHRDPLRGREQGGVEQRFLEIGVAADEVKPAERLTPRERRLLTHFRPQALDAAADAFLMKVEVRERISRLGICHHTLHSTESCG